MLSTYHINDGYAAIGRRSAAIGLDDLDADERPSEAAAKAGARIAITARFAERFDKVFVDPAFGDTAFVEHAGAFSTPATAPGRHNSIVPTLMPNPQRTPAPQADEIDARPVPRRRCSPLPTWRLKRTLAYIEAHLGDTVSLADLAGAAGLTRMHFAAQFRVATGLRPHEFLLRRRIERAQELLAEPSETLVDVALTVGFQTQAHFTTVFKRFVGETPHRWRRANAA